MEKFVHLFNKNNRKSIFIFIILSIILVLVETFSIALIPLAIDLMLSDNPLIFEYLDFIKYDITSFDQTQILLIFGAIFLLLSLY